MKFTTLRIRNFQSFGPTPTALTLTDMTYVLGPNGAGKTAALEALSRLFSPVTTQRKIRISDFHVPVGLSLADLQDKETVLWIEVDIEFPESGSDSYHASIPPNFHHMMIESTDGVPKVRVRLTATLALDGVVEEKIEYIHQVDESGEPTSRTEMSRYDRGYIEVHYLPARRDPSEHIAYTATSLIGRTLRAANWSQERTTLSSLSEQLNNALTCNDAVSSMGLHLKKQWDGLHQGKFFTDPTIGFGQGELEGVLRHLTINFSPSHDGAPLPFDLLSDGQKSLLYISLVLAWQSLSRRVLRNEETSLDSARLRPPVHTIIALEEPENSLSPHYLGRIIRQLQNACKGEDVQALIATHASTLLRRVEPESVCFLRLNTNRETTVHRILLPENDNEAAKYVREAVHAYPELYFSRLVILGEGDSEQVVLPRILAAAGIAEDDASISVVPLGGRHVNHFWRLLKELKIPHVTLLDLDCGRHQAGWGRIRYALNQINKVQPNTYAKEAIDKLPEWNSPDDFPQFVDPQWPNGLGPVQALERNGVFFSNPVDLDLLMLEAFPDAYCVTARPPDEKAVVAVLGKSHANEKHLPEEVLSLFDDYHANFDLKSKPDTHLHALSKLTDKELLEGMPEVFQRLIDHVKKKLSELPE
ncbi:ATP-dependent nuclease [Corynebacterium pseudogenitalium]|uniref:AAA family ATPase n=1 Tax=Corynebacterium pseudogenitalium TaxID=38303 RepID=A0ABD4TTN7_9CORY|nr:AAA family ATPase [Corynebacterium pseudogenitalium]MCQ4615000.1 AAA family ATPase [Corynebacterium pseudogenitalium]